MENQISPTYISALTVLLVSVLSLFKIQVGNEVITALLTGVLGLYIAIRKYRQGRISIVGVRK